MKNIFFHLLLNLQEQFQAPLLYKLIIHTISGMGEAKCKLQRVVKFGIPFFDIILKRRILLVNFFK